MKKVKQRYSPHTPRTISHLNNRASYDDFFDEDILPTDLQVAGSVQQQVARFEVTMQHVRRVDVLQTSQDLIEEVTDMVITQLLCLQQLIQIRLHQALHDVSEQMRVKEGKRNDKLMRRKRFFLKSTTKTFHLHLI